MLAVCTRFPVSQSPAFAPDEHELSGRGFKVCTELVKGCRDWLKAADGHSPVGGNPDSISHFLRHTWKGRSSEPFDVSDASKRGALVACRVRCCRSLPRQQLRQHFFRAQVVRLALVQLFFRLHARGDGHKAIQAARVVSCHFRFAYGYTWRSEEIPLRS